MLPGAASQKGEDHVFVTTLALCHGQISSNTTQHFASLRPLPRTSTSPCCGCMRVQPQHIPPPCMSRSVALTLMVSILTMHVPLALNEQTSNTTPVCYTPPLHTRESEARSMHMVPFSGATSADPMCTSQSSISSCSESPTSFFSVQTPSLSPNMSQQHCNPTSRIQPWYLQALTDLASMDMWPHLDPPLHYISNQGQHLSDLDPKNQKSILNHD